MIDGDDRQLFERSLRHATETYNGLALDAALRDLGWHDALSVDSRTAVSLLFELQGATNAVSSALDHLLASTLGNSGAAIVLPRLGTWRAPGAQDVTRLAVRGVGTASLGQRETALVVAPVAPASEHDGSGATETMSGRGRAGSHVVFEVPTASLKLRTVTGLDPSLGLFEVTGDVDDAQERGPVEWRPAVALGQLALGHELVGASGRMLELAREHALERIQFGRPIATFQAVRHRLADTLVAVEAARAMLDDAWQSGTPQVMAMAKATAGRSAREAARQCQQVLAGIGFTTEHPFHRYVRRALVLEQLLGSTRSLARELGHEILGQQELPPLLPL